MKKIFTLIAAAAMALSANAQKSWVFSDFDVASYEKTTTINGLTINAASGKAISIDESSATVTINGNEVTYTKRLKFGGTGAADRCVSFQVDGASKITVVATSSSSSGEARKLNVSYGNSYGASSIGTIDAPVGERNVGSVNYTGSAATTIYIGSASSGVNIYAIYVEAGEAGPEATEWNFSTWEDENTGFSNQVKNNLGLFACYKNAETQITNFGKINGSNKSPYTKRFQLGGGGAALEGTGTPTQRFVYFNVKGNSDITVQFVSGSSGSARDLFISDGTTVLSKTTSSGDGLNEAKATYTGNAGVIYIYAGSAVNLYDIKATNVGTTVLLDDTTKPTGIETLKAAKAAFKGATYNVAGQQVDAAYKGLVIKDGKKYVNK